MPKGAKARKPAEKPAAGKRRTATATKKKDKSAVTRHPHDLYPTTVYYSIHRLTL